MPNYSRDTVERQAAGVYLMRRRDGVVFYINRRRINGKIQWLAQSDQQSRIEHARSLRQLTWLLHEQVSPEQVS